MGEGVQGFARTALAGGIPCLLASKWNVPAKESIILMTRVYAFMALNKVGQLAKGRVLNRRKVKCDVICIATQDKYQTVAEALQTAVVSLLEDEDMKYKTSFYYWAAFICHGFASVRLDDTLLDQIHNRLETLYGQQQQHQPDDNSEENDAMISLSTATLTLTREAYHRLEEWEETLSREWCEKWGAQTSD